MFLCVEGDGPTLEEEEEAGYTLRLFRKFLQSQQLEKEPSAMFCYFFS